ncbi:MAG: riboflavin synthase [Planctomycetes bacterium]|nr:riboflavin synthase [Planctomycetota bacterium]
MFTGIIEHVGVIRRVARRPKGARLTVDVGPCADGTRLGDSIALDGVCLTVVALAGAQADFDAVAETLRRSTLGARKAGDAVNCERALRVGQALGGHFVQGHVDGRGRVRSLVRAGEGKVLTVDCPAELAAGMVEKGSIAIDGVSLTLVDVGRDRLSVALVPFTLAHTTLGRRRKGDPVNLEVDVIGKYVRKLLAGVMGRTGAGGMGVSGGTGGAGAESATAKRAARTVRGGTGITLESLRAQGFA